MKTSLVIVTLIKLTEYILSWAIAIYNLFMHPNGLTDLTESLKQRFLG